MRSEALFTCRLAQSMLMLNRSALAQLEQLSSFTSLMRTLH